MSTIVARPTPPAELPDRDLELVAAGKEMSPQGGDTLFGPRAITDSLGGRPSR
jgi:hypothetical protein